MKYLLKILRYIPNIHIFYRMHDKCCRNDKKCQKLLKKSHDHKVQSLFDHDQIEEWPRREYVLNKANF